MVKWLFLLVLCAVALPVFAGREVLVHGAKNSITYNDISGQSCEVPIISQKPSETASQSK